MKTGFKQACGLMQLTSPFGADDLLLDSLAGSEGLSELFGLRCICVPPAPACARPPPSARK